MSYPDFGCYAECLVCELCEGLPPPPEPEPDLDFDADDYDDLFGDDDDVDDWAPPPDDDKEGGLFDDFELPPVYPRAEPKDGGWIFGAGGRF